MVPKPPVDNNFVSQHCLQDDSVVLPIDTQGAQVDIQVPADACALFGPQTPPAPPGQPPGRPRDPDETGGYYQPVRVHVPALGLTALAGIRIVCGLPYATPEVAAAYRMQYVRNRNPEVAELNVQHNGIALAPDTIPVGEKISLRLRPSSDSAESFVLFNPLTQLLRPEVERLRVSWFCGRGSFEFATTSSDPHGAILNTWLAPDSPGPVLLWAVLRDSRGGVSVFSQRVQASVRDGSGLK